MARYIVEVVVDIEENGDPRAIDYLMEERLGVDDPDSEYTHQFMYWHAVRYQ